VTRAAPPAAAYLSIPHVPHVPHTLKRLLPGIFQDQVQISRASQLYLGGMDLVAIQQALGHAWVATTMNYIHVHATHVEDAWVAGQQRAARRLKGLGP
jgi:integrase/recombinase XerD